MLAVGLLWSWNVILKPNTKISLNVPGGGVRIKTEAEKEGSRTGPGVCRAKAISWRTGRCHTQILDKLLQLGGCVQSHPHSTFLTYIYSVMPSPFQRKISGMRHGYHLSDDPYSILPCPEPEGNKNVFAVAAILVDYSDGTTQTVVIDTTWKTIKTTLPRGWTSSSFENSAWIAAAYEMLTASTP
ncbi:uncharacterized protein BT62DRAFT_1079409 [Guyanagaster necrorhizus]|uniref:Uncharacterized protein n=1 Tax=Guyanagaster necrorhizus TaxID=856835 RepID=A0A9P8APX6_9AGAR|nr:uncharacterized protein BT62DRAFT_1079409 [Guyanagaster necrorhizus MCA 3950]KAG7442297.1 hypothetical protein BT62DRAFT_1079409 [Guyanagaster necrorhizus MCA 3950]